MINAATPSKFFFQEQVGVIESSNRSEGLALPGLEFLTYLAYF
jgi:hypothetical protein